MKEPQPAPAIGFDLPDWSAPSAPETDLVLDGQFVRLEPLAAAKHATPLFQKYEGHDVVWTYLPVGPFEECSSYRNWVETAEQSSDPHFFAIWNKDTKEYEGTLSLLRIKPETGSIEVGFITFSPALQKTRAATEAIFLTMKYAFEVGYRRFEWKCDALNVPSRKAAQRLGLSYEGIFRQATIVKGRNRDTAWFAAIDSEWPNLHQAFSRWLDPSNFDDEGQQIIGLSDLTQPILVATDPEVAN
ncbi:MAG: GNAT family protein [Paracoccaceae bacterium]